MNITVSVEELREFESKLVAWAHKGAENYVVVKSYYHQGMPKSEHEVIKEKVAQFERDNPRPLLIPSL